jgi:hypothetical protein
MVGNDSVCAKADGTSVKAVKTRAVENFMVRAVVKMSSYVVYLLYFGLFIPYRAICKHHIKSGGVGGVLGAEHRVH